MRPLVDMYIGINDPAIEAQGLLREHRLEVGPGQQRLGDLPLSDIVQLWLPVVFESDDELHGVGFAGPQPCQTGIGEVGRQAIARQDSCTSRCRLSCSRAGLKWYYTAAPKPTERTLCTLIAVYSHPGKVIHTP
jgi:hypothetical protein